MKYSFDDHGPTSVLTISGELMHDQVDALRRVCLERLGRGVQNIVLNLEHLTMADSAALEFLLWLRDELSTRHGQMRLVRMDHTVRKILEITRLEKKFEAHESIEAAAKTLR
jgi:anti-anti-sigma factor